MFQGVCRVAPEYRCFGPVHLNYSGEICKLMAYAQQSILRGAKEFLGNSYLKKADDGAMFDILRRKKVLLMGSAYLLAIKLHLEVVIA